MSKDGLPLLLLDNSTMYVIGKGTYKVEPVSFAEAKDIIDTFSVEDILRCYTDNTIDQVIHDFVGVEYRDFPRKKIREMRPGQMAITFKQHIETSSSQPIVEPEEGIQAKKIQNIYIYCEIITRMS